MHITTSFSLPINFANNLDDHDKKMIKADTEMGERKCCPLFHWWAIWMTLTTNLFLLVFTITTGQEQQLKGRGAGRTSQWRGESCQALSRWPDVMPWHQAEVQWEGGGQKPTWQPTKKEGQDGMMVQWEVAVW
jgi:hypothetical protein